MGGNKRGRRVSGADARTYAIEHGADPSDVTEFARWARDWFANAKDAWSMWTKIHTCRCAPCESGRPENCYKCPSCHKIHGVITGCNPPAPNWTIGLTPS